MNDIDRLSINTVRLLSVEGVQKANSGHPGLPLGAAPMAYTLWSRHYEAQPEESQRGPTATASCCRRGTAPCCSIRCCTCSAIPRRWTT